MSSNAVTQKFKLGYGDYLRFRNLVLERSGLYFPEKKMRDLEAGLLKALAESSIAPVNGHYDLDHSAALRTGLRPKAEESLRAYLASSGFRDSSLP